MIDVGDVCLKVAGRDGGNLCVVLERVDDNYVLVTGPKKLTGVRKRKCNISHLEPVGVRLKISKTSSEEEIAEALKKSGVLEKFGKK